jgi:hypothetical protein
VIVQIQKCEYESFTIYLKWLMLLNMNSHFCIFSKMSWNSKWYYFAISQNSIHMIHTGLHYKTLYSLVVCYRHTWLSLQVYTRHRANSIHIWTPVSKYHFHKSQNIQSMLIPLPKYICKHDIKRIIYLVANPTMARFCWIERRMITTGLNKGNRSFSLQLTKRVDY